MDLNTKLANYCMTCLGQAQKSRTAAAEVRGRPKTGWDEYDRQTDAEASGHDAAAKKWSDRCSLLIRARCSSTTTTFIISGSIRT